ncbi:hypothetical protein C8R45DRAFT_817264 [Mycena sanguinolenta]|nr:hypothetical protein C8R45DRAFT_817264 [Mycena sanguinolenta]
MDWNAPDNTSDSHGNGTGDKAPPLASPPLCLSPPPLASLPPASLLPHRSAAPPDSVQPLALAPSPPLSVSLPPASSPPPSPPASSPPPCPANAPEWFSQAREQVTAKYLGPHFNAVLAAWTRVEAACKFENPAHKLSPKNRPAMVGTWITGARGKKQAPPTVRMEEVPALELDFWKWWGSLQPEWRVKGANGSWVIGEEYGGEWEDALLHWGVNSTLSVVACLFFWGCAVCESSDLCARWETAVHDVAWILAGLAVFHEKFNKQR